MSGRKENELTSPDKVQPILRRFLPGDDHAWTVQAFYDQIQTVDSLVNRTTAVHLLPSYLSKVYEKFVELLNLSQRRPKFYDNDNGNYKGSVLSMYKMVNLLSDILGWDQAWHFGIRTRNSGDRMTVAISREDQQFNQIEYEPSNKRLSIFWHTLHPTDFIKIGRTDWFPFSSQVRTAIEKNPYSNEYIMWLSFTVKRMRLRSVNRKNRFDYMPDSLTPLPGYDNRSDELFRGSETDCVRLQKGILDDLGLEKLHELNVD